ncbi:hypothetical protein CRUP_035273 [Coryphaenoides rupestris]|nr:hypothetical protein CRUP_035273 [Coryphaenoides rupestris]
MVTIPDCVDSGTQTEISFENLLTLGKGVRGGRGRGQRITTETISCVLDGNHGDYVSMAQHEEDRHPNLEYEEVSLYRSSQQEKLGLTVCYRTDDEEEDVGIYVGEVNPHSIAGRNGRIQEGDRILQINGVDIQNRDEAVAILSREDSINLFLLLARPEQEAGEEEEEEEEEEERGGGGEVLIETSPELDSGVGRTEESFDLLEQSSTCYTNTTSTPGSLAMLR